MSPERSAESWGEEGGAGSLSPVGEAAPSAEASGWSINAREQGAKGLRKGKGKSWLESSPLLPGGGVIQAGGVRRKGGEPGAGGERGWGGRGRGCRRVARRGCRGGGPSAVIGGGGMAARGEKRSSTSILYAKKINRSPYKILARARNYLSSRSCLD